MRYRFSRFEVDTERYRLSADGTDIHLEPLVFDLLAFLLSQSGRVVTRDALVQHVWQGRFVSDATVASAVRSLRDAIDDDGRNPTLLQTVRGRGFQFTAAVSIDAPEPPTHAAGPPRIAVLPFVPLGGDPALSLIGEALAQEAILELSRLHWMFVIARGSSFRFRGPEVDLARAGEALGARYFLTGTILAAAPQFEIAVELCAANDATVIWADRFAVPAEGMMQMRATLAGHVVAALEPRLQASEALRAARLPTDRMDAWAAYHRALAHMYRFTRSDNEAAARLFTQALSLDPSFARAQAGLSFTHFLDVFLGFSADPAADRALVRRHADLAMELDPLDPFVNLTMGRAEWLRGQLAGGLGWMEHAIALCPNHAFATYNSALVGTLMGESSTSQDRVGRAMALSPLDPLHYAMLATRALTHVIRGEFDAAAEWTGRAVRAPNAHIHIFAIAAFAHQRAGRADQARIFAAQVRAANPGYRAPDFLAVFPFTDAAARATIQDALRDAGL